MIWPLWPITSFLTNKKNTKFISKNKKDKVFFKKKKKKQQPQQKEKNISNFNGKQLKETLTHRCSCHPRVLLGTIWSQILHLFSFIIINILFFLLAFIIPWVRAIKRALRRAVRGIYLLGVREPWSVRLRAWPTKPSPSPTASGSIQECSNAASSSSSLAFNWSSLESSFSSLL